jgi:hypothetical protein
LHRGHPEIGQDAIDTLDTQAGQARPQTREVAPHGDELGFRPSSLSESFCGLGQLDRVTIKANQTPVGSEASQEFAGMATKAECAVNEGLSGLRFERF